MATGTASKGQMTWSRRRLLRTATIGGGATALAGCGPAEAPSAGAGKSAQPVSLEFQHRWEGSRKDLIDKLIAEYRAAKPHVQIDNQLVFGSGEGFFDGMPYDKILTQVAAGTPPDVIMIGSDMAAAWARRGTALRALDQALKRDKIDPAKVFYPALAQMARATGKYYGLPQLTANDRAYLFMNKDVVAAAGLDAAKGPQSWDELVTWSQKLTKREGATLAQIGLDFPGQTFIDWLARNNGAVLSEDAAKVAFDSPAGQATLEWLLSATKQVYGSAQAVQELEATDKQATYTGKVNLWTGQVAAFFTISQDAPKANPSFQLAVSIAPHNAKNSQARPTSLAEKIWMYAQGHGIQGPRADAGYDFLKYLTLGDGNKQFVLAQGRPSPVVRFNDNLAYKQENPWWDTIVKRAFSLMSPMPQTPAWNGIRRVLNTMTDQVMAGKQGVREALAEAARESQILLDETRR